MLTAYVEFFQPCTSSDPAFLFLFSSACMVISLSKSNLAHQINLFHAPSRTSSMEFHAHFEGGRKMNT